MSLPTPNTRKEQYLNAIATGNAGGLPTPITREEEYLNAIAKSGGGGSGDGDMKKSVYDSDLAVADAGGISAFVDDAVSGKVDKVAGKGLSTNDYDDTEKGKVADNTGAIEAITPVKENVTGGRIVRIGKMRMLLLNSTAQHISSLSLNSSDFPSYGVSAIALVNDSNSTHIQLGYVNVTVDGIITCNVAPGYNTTDGYTVTTSNTLWFNCSILWWAN